MNPLKAALNAKGAAEQKIRGVGRTIKNAVVGAVNTRVQEQKNYDAALKNGDRSKYYGTASDFKK